MTYDESITAMNNGLATARTAIKDAINALMSATGMTSTQMSMVSSKIESLATAAAILQSNVVVTA